MNILSSSVLNSEDSFQEKDRRQKTKNLFTVTKGDVYDMLLNDEQPESSNNEDEIEDSPVSNQNKKTLTTANRISAFSKVNFSKLSEKEKDQRLQNLVKLVKKLRKRVKDYENKKEQNEKKKNLKISKVNENKDLQKLISFYFKANSLYTSYLKKTKNSSQNYISTFLELIAGNKLKVDSIYYFKICKQIQKCIEESNRQKLLIDAEAKESKFLSQPQNDPIMNNNVGSLIQPQSVVTPHMNIIPPSKSTIDNSTNLQFNYFNIYQNNNHPLATSQNLNHNYMQNFDIAPYFNSNQQYNNSFIQSLPLYNQILHFQQMNSIFNGNHSLFM